MASTQNYLKIATDLIQDFRKRLFLIGFILMGGTIFGYYKSHIAMNYLFSKVKVVIFISPTEGFVTKIKIAFILGFILTVPLILFILLNFIHKRFNLFSRGYIVFLTLIGYILFLVGASFALFVVLPIGLTFLLGFATPDLEPMLSVGNYVSFATVFILVFGITFEMPLIILSLTGAGILNSNILRQKRKYVLLIIFLVAGFLTPPDVVSQILMAIPLLVLYELSIFFARIREGKKTKATEKSTSDEDDAEEEITKDLMKKMF